jgi:taurine dioxygenase
VSAKINPLTETFGVEIRDVDLSQSLNEVDLVREWQLHRLVVVRDQALSIDRQMEIARLFGPLGELGKVEPGASEYARFVMDVTNLDLGEKKSYLPSGEMYFHFDTSYLPQPYSACFLYGIEVPSVGGETLFADGVSALERLPSSLRQRLIGLIAENAYDYSDEEGMVRRKKPRPEAMRSNHPVVRRLPPTNEGALFINRLMTHQVVGMSEAESENLLMMLFDVIEDPKFVYEHRWLRGDLVIWDNRSVLHARRDFPLSERRHLRRVSVIGEAPQAYG